MTREFPKMLKRLQISFLLILAIAIGSFSVWRYFRGGAWWLAAGVALVGYASLLSAFFMGNREAWHSKVIRLVFDSALSTSLRAFLSLIILTSLTAVLSVLAYRARPVDTNYYEVRVYDQVDLPGRYQVGAVVVLHTRTNGLTYRESVSPDGGAVFGSLPVPTTLAYQVEVSSATPPFLIGGSNTIDRLPNHLAIDTSMIPPDKRVPLSPLAYEQVTSIPRPHDYLANANELGDKSLQSSSAPWGVPKADVIVNRLGYVLGYDLARRMPKWVAYSIGPTTESVPRIQRFVPDPAIAPDRQARVSDYNQSGFDRGHMISPADLFFKGPLVVEEAFYMSTVTPQTPWLNRRLWSDVEVRVRKTVESRHQIAFVIAGPLFIAAAE